LTGVELVWEEGVKAVEEAMVLSGLESGDGRTERGYKV
jgi:hypothetical protein